MVVGRVVVEVNVPVLNVVLTTHAEGVVLTITVISVVLASQVVVVVGIEVVVVSFEA
jgi:hypothetical protein